MDRLGPVLDLTTPYQLHSLCSVEVKWTVND